MFRLPPWDLDRLTPAELYDLTAAIDELEADADG